MKHTRRDALAGMAASVAAATPALAQTGPGQSTSGRIRKAAATLNANSDDVLAFGEGVRLMKQRSDARSWTRQNQIHRFQAQHGNALFLPWHRLQVAHMERIIGRLTGHLTFAMPYWDWQAERFLPTWVTRANSPLYEAQRAPGVATLDFAAARWAASRNGARLSQDSFATFAGRLPNGAGSLETYGHNLIHTLVGGLMSRVETAAADPVFWLHHCNVDRAWATWHQRTGGVYPADFRQARLGGFVGPQGENTGTWLAGNIVEPRSLGYRYDQLYPFQVFLTRQAAPAEGARTSTLTLRGQIDPRTPGRMVIVLPADLAARLRRPRGQVSATGEGTISYRKDALLLDRSIEVNIFAGGRATTIATSPTFLHLGSSQPGMEGHAHHADSYVIGFRIEDELRAAAEANATGPVAILVDAQDLVPQQRRGPPQPEALSVTLTLTET